MFVGVVIDRGVLLCCIVLYHAVLYNLVLWGSNCEEGEGCVYSVNSKVSRIYVFTEVKLSTTSNPRREEK